MNCPRFINTRAHLPPSFSAQFCHLSSQLWSSFSQLAMTFNIKEWLHSTLKTGDFTSHSRSLMKIFRKPVLVPIPQGTHCGKLIIHPVKQTNSVLWPVSSTTKDIFSTPVVTGCLYCVKGLLKIQIYYVLCILLIHVLMETFTGLQQDGEAEFPVVEAVLILDSFYLCAQWSYSYHKAYPLTRKRRIWSQLLIPERLNERSVQFFCKSCHARALCNMSVEYSFLIS